MTRPLICFLLLASPLAAQQQYLSPSDIACSADGSALYIACATGNRILVFDTKAEKVSAQGAQEPSVES